MSKVSSFELVVLRPVPGKVGSFVFSATKYAETISEAVKSLRKEIESSGFVVVQAAEYYRNMREPKNPALIYAISEAYDKKFAI